MERSANAFDRVGALRGVDSYKAALFPNDYMMNR